jgi:hypothetical protein
VPGYRPPSTEPRGKWAKRIHEKRRAEGLSQTGAFELLGERLGFGPKSRFSYVALDMGTREPTEAEAKVLAAWLGGYPTDSAPDPATTTQPADALVAVLTRQAEAIEALVERLDVLTAGQATAAGEMMRALGILGGHPAPQGTPPVAEREARGDTVR